MNRTMLRSLALAVLIGLLFGLSPHTSATRMSVKIVGGLAVGVVVFLLRLRAERRVEAARLEAGAGAPSGIPPLLWLTLALTVLLLLPAAGSLYRHYTEDIWTNGHGLFVPIVVVALALAILRRDSSQEAESSVWGYVAVLAGIVLLVLESAVMTLYMSILGLLLVLVGLSLVLLGLRRTRALAFPLFLTLFLLPLPSSLAMPLGLNQATVSGVAWVFNALGSPAWVNDTLIETASGRIAVSAHCSGFSTLYFRGGPCPRARLLRSLPPPLRPPRPGRLAACGSREHPANGVRRQSIPDKQRLLIRDGFLFLPRPPCRPGTPSFFASSSVA